MPAHSGKVVSYYRASTDKQGKSGLGLSGRSLDADAVGSISSRSSWPRFRYW